jgi:hypothetical protein
MTWPKKNGDRKSIKEERIRKTCCKGERVEVLGVKLGSGR